MQGTNSHSELLSFGLYGLLLADDFKQMIDVMVVLCYSFTSVISSSFCMCVLKCIHCFLMVF